MLTLAKVVSAESAATYYEESDDYYSEGGRAPSAWWGQGAAALALSGPVDSGEFRALLDGQLPNGDSLHRGGEGPRTAGLDLTFSAPKSISLQALVGGDQRLLEAHEAAVTATLRHVEEHLAAYRSTSDGETVSVQSGSIVAARFGHDLSREADPQVHTHCVLVNMTQRPNGEWRALDARPLYEQQKLLGAFYRAELARAVQALGYQVRRTHEDGRFELAHIKDFQVDAFSTRRRAIDVALAARGQDRDSASAREREIAGLSTRRSKDRSVDRAALREAWQAKAAELGISWTPLAAAAQSEADRQVAAAEAVGFAVSHLMERSAIVTRANIAHIALGHGTGLVVLVEVQREIDRRIGCGELLVSGDGRRLTTAAAQALEREVLDVEKRGRDALEAAIVNREPVQAKLFSATVAKAAQAVKLGEGLTAGQRRAVELVLTTQDRIVGVQGLAGTGKTTMLRTVRNNLGTTFRAVGLAPSAAAARELEAAGITSMTIAGFLTGRGRPFKKNDLVVVDEAGMVSLRDMHGVLAAVEKAGARAVLVGDTAQLKAVEAGAPFRQLQRNGMQTERMDEILRHTDDNLRDAVLDAAEGRIAASVAKLAATVHELPHATQRYERIADDYATMPPVDRQQTLLVAGTNRARCRINELVRQRLGRAGTGVVVKVLEKRDLTRAQIQSSLSYSRGDVVEALRHYDSIGMRRGDTARVVSTLPGCITLRRCDGNEVEWRPIAMPHVAVHTEEEREFAAGDRLRFTANDYGVGVVNGQTGMVETIDAIARLMTVRADEGAVMTLNIDQALRADHGYCTTVHAAQGQTCERVMVDADVSSATANQSLYYVAISRARSTVTLYTDDRELLPGAMSRLDIKHAALDLERNREPAMAL
ncbi:MAG: relaxase domain-containing protein [Methylibium sp.]|uniref:MobF family relaxase n=1 Tax=Methylibium sp. TaxID=2067992 RepID=UPI0017AF0A19|nr:MobF family relaxase [Methylibium sp.]MBA3598872.1 relaxase domain-containing protein [Methylibium sp.]